VRASITAGGMWELPLGRVPIEGELAEALLGSCSVLEKDTEAHRAEHSLEVQVPFLYHLNPRVRIVPIILMPRSVEECVRMGEEIARVIRGWKSAVLIVASTDLTHYEPRPSAREKDRLAIQQMMALNPEGLYQTVAAHKISMCGFIPTTVALAAWRALGVTGMEFVGYSDSGDTSGDTARVVGYAGLIVRG
jgi:MEMO1 family protein